MGDVCRMLDVPIASRALQVLADYERAADALLARGLDAAVYSEGARLFHDLQLLATDLPQARVAWVELLISRFEFTHVLWTAGGRQPAAGSIRSMGSAHLAAIARFRDKCQSVYLERASGCH